jgi:hypothetical protein
MNHFAAAHGQSFEHAAAHAISQDQRLAICLTGKVAGYNLDPSGVSGLRSLFGHLAAAPRQAISCDQHPPI